MFIRPDEHIIIMDQGSNLLMPDELVALRDAGIQTVYLTGAVQWNEIQPRPGVWNWQGLDTAITGYERAGIKALIGCFSQIPFWKDWSWYFNRQGRGVMSYTNPETAADIDDLVYRLIHRYGSDTVQIVYAMPGDGEFPMTHFPGGGRLPMADETIAAWVVERQRQFVAQHGEVWSAFHFSCFPTYIWPTHQALKAAYPDANHYSLQYTYWQHPHNVQNAVQAVQKALGIQYYVGSEYIQGMKDVTPHAIAHGVRLITSPIHFFQEHRRIEPWMLDVIRDTLRQYEEADA